MAEPTQIGEWGESGIGQSVGRWEPRSKWAQDHKILDGRLLTLVEFRDICWDQGVDFLPSTTRLLFRIGEFKVGADKLENIEKFI